MTVTLIWPGYWSSVSIFLATSRESQSASSSVMLGRLDHDAELASGLHREGLLDALEPVGDVLELLQALDVRLRISRRAPGRAAESASAPLTSTASSERGS